MCMFGCVPVRKGSGVKPLPCEIEVIVRPSWNVQDHVVEPRRDGRPPVQGW